MNKKGKCSEFSPLYIAKSRVEKYATDQTGDSSKCDSVVLSAFYRPKIQTAETAEACS